LKSLRKLRVLPVLAVAFLYWGCTTIPTASVQTFAGGVSNAQTLTDTVFSTVSLMTSADSIAFASTQPTLKAANLVSCPDAPTMAAWDSLLAAIGKYAQALENLTGTATTQAFSNSMVNLAGQFNQTSTDLQTRGLTGSAPQASANMATAFTEVASVLMRAHASAKAREIAAEADPNISAICAGLADAIGATADDGLRSTVAAHWRDSEGALQVQFLGTHDPNMRLSITNQFAAKMAAEQAEDLTLVSLRRAILAIAEAHHALAQGQDATLAGAVGAIATELGNAQALRAQFLAKQTKQ
jgi:hypothetical protein